MVQQKLKKKGCVKGYESKYLAIPWAPQLNGINLKECILLNSNGKNSVLPWVTRHRTMRSGKLKSIKYVFWGQ